jgi:ATP-dependent Clp protease ATP-binding subunit ClpC
MKPSDRDRHRYDAEVRQAMERANELTLRLNHDHLGSEHLLGGLLRDEHGTAARLLREAGADPRELLRRLMGSLVPGKDMVTSSRIPRTPCLVSAIERAEQIADDLGHREVDGRHLLLGLAAGDGLAADLLRAAGVSAHPLRSRMGGPGPTPLGDGGAGPAGNGAG